MFSEIDKNSREELLKEVENNINANKPFHDAAVVMGSLGVSPKHFMMYQNAVKKIDEHNKKYG